ncbi:MAG: hypothetical protein ACRDNK_18010 [Solirubrobacteraceae bacterium]
MKLTDTSQWPEGVGEIRFEPQRETSTGANIKMVSEHGAELGLLAAVTDSAAQLPIRYSGDCQISVDASWEVLVADSSGVLRDHRLLFRGQETIDESAQLTDEVAAWATLTLLWALAPDTSGRGQG